MAAKNIEITVNGPAVSSSRIEGEMLADLLRDRLRLNWRQDRLQRKRMRACTVVYRRRAGALVQLPGSQGAGKNVTTIEGLAGKKPSADLHPLQDAFIQYGAVQCGFCIPGQLMTSYALLEHNPDPSEDDIKYALKDTLCRCAGYPAIIGAVQAAGKSLRTGEPVKPPDVAPSPRAKKAVGTITPRPDAVAKVTGKAVYTDDLEFDGMLHARVKRAMLPSAIVKRPGYFQSQSAARGGAV